jgi:hypothetical protein
MRRCSPKPATFAARAKARAFIKLVGDGDGAARAFINPGVDEYQLLSEGPGFSPVGSLTLRCELSRGLQYQ